MSLPLPWVNKIFDKLTLVYGRTFLDRWAGLDLDTVKADWAHELDGLDRSPKSITYALQHLDPDRAPTVLQFRTLAYKAPADVPVMIAAPPPDPKTIADNLMAMAPARKPSYADPKAWAHRIIKRAEQGDKIKPYTLKCAQQALGIKPQEKAA